MGKSTVYCLLLTLCCLLLTACGDAATPPPAATALPPAPATATPAVAVTKSTPLPQDQAALPVELRIPALNFTVAVTPMAWQVTQVAGERSAVWQVPEDKAGWHINSARAGALGNVVISGHHLQGKAVFAALARGEVEVGQQILLTDERGKTFVYQVTEVAAPIPVLSATAEDQAHAAAYMAPSTQAKLTLVTGWPEFSDTHLLFIVAQFSGTSS